MCNKIIDILQILRNILTRYTFLHISLNIKTRSSRIKIRSQLIT